MSRTALLVGVVFVATIPRTVDAQRQPAPTHRHGRRRSRSAQTRHHATRRWALIAVLALCLAATVLAGQHRAHAQTATLTDLSVANVTARSALTTVTATSPGTVYVRYSLTSTEN